MTIEEANAAALRASMAGDLAALKQALATRSEAIRELVADAPSEALASRIRCAIEAGNFLTHDLRGIHGRLTQLRSVAATEPIDPRVKVSG